MISSSRALGIPVTDASSFLPISFVPGLCTYTRLSLPPPSTFPRQAMESIRGREDSQLAFYKVTISSVNAICHRIIYGTHLLGWPSDGLIIYRRCHNVLRDESISRPRTTPSPWLRRIWSRLSPLRLRLPSAHRKSCRNDRLPPSSISRPPQTSVATRLKTEHVPLGSYFPSIRAISFTPRGPRTVPHFVVKRFPFPF